MLTLHLVLTLAAVAVSRVLCFIFVLPFTFAFACVARFSERLGVCYVLFAICCRFGFPNALEWQHIHTCTYTGMQTNTLQSLSRGNNGSFHSSEFAFAFVSFVLDSLLKINEHCIIYSAFAIHLLIMYPLRVSMDSIKLIKLGKKYMWAVCIWYDSSKNSVVVCQQGEKSIAFCIPI